MNGSRGAHRHAAGLIIATAERKARRRERPWASKPSMMIQAGERQRIRSLLLALAAMLSAITIWSGIAPASAHACANVRAAATSVSSSQVGSAVRCLVNAQRSAHGLGPMRSSADLRRAARLHAVDMVRRRYFDHVSPDGRTVAQRVKRTGYLSGARRWALGENIGWGSGEMATPTLIVRAWMRSSGHRRNILDRRFRHIGIGVASGAPAAAVSGSAATYTTDFGSRVLG